MSRLGASATNRVAKSTSARHAAHASATIWGSGTAPSKSPSRSVAEQYSRGTSWPAISTRNVARSTSARCRTSPSSDIVDGSAERRAIASASSPAHFISRVKRAVRRASASVARSSPSLGPFSRGSSSDGLPSSVNMSARRVVAMAAIIGDSTDGRQGNNRARSRVPLTLLSRVLAGDEHRGEQDQRRPDPQSEAGAAGEGVPGSFDELGPGDRVGCAGGVVQRGGDGLPDRLSLRAGHGTERGRQMAGEAGGEDGAEHGDAEGGA